MTSHEHPFPARTDFKPWSNGDWRARSLCPTGRLVVGGAEEDRHMTFRQMKQLCYDCPVTQECLQWALDSTPGPGVFGGCTEEQRHELAAEGARMRRLLSS